MVESKVICPGAPPPGRHYECRPAKLGLPLCGQRLRRADGELLCSSVPRPSRPARKSWVWAGSTPETCDWHFLLSLFSRQSGSSLDLPQDDWESLHRLLTCEAGSAHTHGCGVLSEVGSRAAHSSQRASVAVAQDSAHTSTL